MPIYSRTGRPRSGKSYESVKTDIVGAIAMGIDVYAFIDGLKVDAIREYAAAQAKKELDEVGHLYILTKAQVQSPKLFPRIVDGVVYDEDSIVKAGARTVIDECRKFYSPGMKILPEHHEFFREHGHICHPVTGVNCDIILISQSIADFDRSIKVVFEKTFRTKKLSSLGLGSRYSLEIFDGGSTAFSAREELITPLKYDKRIFALYSSASNNNAVQATIDKRVNVLTNPRFIGLMIGAVGFIGYAGYYFISSYSSDHGSKGTAGTLTGKTASRPPASAAATGPVPSSGAPVTVSRSGGDYRLSGFYTVGQSNYAIVEYLDGSGHCRVKYLTIGAGSVLDGPRSSVVVDGKSVATYNSSPCAVSAKGTTLAVGLK